jgi:glucose-1-phosphate cytidylyltransferase
MKVAILAGGFGTRLGELTEKTPKPMVEIGGKPILWHIMMHFSHHGFRHFIIALGYKGDTIKRYIRDYSHLHGDFTVGVRDASVELHGNRRPDWIVELRDTGLRTLTGGRVKRLAPIIGDEPFLLAWGDGVSDVDLQELVAFHRSHGKLATVVAVRPPARFGHMEIEGSQVVDFSEKPQTAEGWINGGFFVLQPEVFNFIAGDDTAWEHEPLEALARSGELMAFKHTSFWHCMDTLRDRRILEDLWERENAPWCTWKEDDESTGHGT